MNWNLSVQTLLLWPETDRFMTKSYITRINTLGTHAEKTWMRSRVDEQIFRKIVFRIKSCAVDTVGFLLSYCSGKKERKKR